MKLSYYHQALIVTAVVIFYLNVPLYVYENHGFTQIEAPKHWVLLFCLLSLPVLFRRMTAGKVLKSPVMAWGLGYAILTVFWFFLSSQSDMAWQEVRWRFLAMIVILVFLTVFREPDAIRLARKTLVGAVLIAVALNIYELFAPMTFSKVLGRSAGLYENPNLAGEALVLGMILSVTVLGPRYRGPFILLTGIGIFATLSRSSILGWIIAASGLIIVRLVSSKDLVGSAFIGLVLVVLVLLPRWDRFLATWERTGVLNVNVQERLAWFTDPSGVSDQSSWERKYVAQRTWEKISERPFLGNGTGSFHDAPVLPHNLYLSYMLDHGLIGAAVLPLLILTVTWNARGDTKGLAIIFGCAVMVLSFFTHAILSNGYSLLLFAVMAAMTATSRDRESKRTAVMERSGSTTGRRFVNA